MVLDEGPAEARVAAALAVLAGIAAADAICGLRVGKRSRGQDHRQAVALLQEVRLRDTSLPSRLQRLIAEKDAVHYSPNLVTASSAKGLVRHASALLQEANAL